MLPVKYINAKGEEISTQIPISWRDITWAKYVEIESRKFANECERIAFIAGIDIQVLLNNPIFFKAVIDALSFIYEVDVNDYATYIPTRFKELINEKACELIGAKEWGKIETAKASIKANDTEPLKAGASIVKTYLGEDINDLPVVDVIGLVAFFLTK